MKRKLFLFAILLTVVSTVSFAQRGGGQGAPQRQAPEAMAKERANQWQEKFGLSDEQHKKVYDVLLATGEKQSKKMQEMRSSGSFDREGLTKVMTELQTEQDKELKQIFTAEQWTAYEQWKKDNPPMQRRRGGGN